LETNARIPQFAVKELKTMNDLAAAQLALLQDLNSGAVTEAEWRVIQKDLNTFQKKWQKQSHNARTSADFEALTTIWGYKR
jgi:hypothetical protein